MKAKSDNLFQMMRYLVEQSLDARRRRKFWHLRVLINLVIKASTSEALFQGTLKLGFNDLRADLVVLCASKCPPQAKNFDDFCS